MWFSPLTFKSNADKNSFTILLIFHSQDDLWCSVVSGYNVGCHHEVSAGGSGQPKV